MVDGGQSREARIRESIGEIEAQIWEAYEEATEHPWRFHVGRLKIEARLGSVRVTQIFVAFNVAVAAAGAWLIFQHGAAGQLGIAMVVGALFAFGSFVTQYWAVLVQSEIDNKRLLYEPERAQLDRLLREHAKLRRQLAKVSS